MANVSSAITTQAIRRATHATVDCIETSVTCAGISSASSPGCETWVEIGMWSHTAGYEAGTNPEPSSSPLVPPVELTRGDRRFSTVKGVKTTLCAPRTHRIVDSIRLGRSQVRS